MQARILLVEDDPEIARVVRDMLIRENYEVTWATTGLEGWEDFQENLYDLVLVDLMLPEMDGFTLCKNIRWKSDIPLIIISARKEDEDKVAGLHLGADDYVAKPFSLVELKARVASQLRRWRRYQGQEARANTSTYMHGLKVNWDQKQVTLNEVKVPLTSKEYELLEVLAKHPGETFSKTELYEHVWKQLEADGVPTVTVHIKALREKLADPVKNPKFIQTDWGKGYRFIGEPL
ncbi:response regulator [Virgibacillus halodenitrificans]|jgi:two-component system, OmpR family, response regulator|uniref:response regulator transcription factor n=1 Tax=Virgibacillus halodenitrificans TaxID=1482 RepID=UPI00045CE266|nr:response regulator transcription factor [Virgibacillus halodenitrificans]MCG1029089.1 response regulator transcription factor [Virgibacillus halodenitrificans]MCJ0933263.1 response regulator transcription factor [Virgibacillus halodenitrificans]MYL44940.1 response regulator [Virgibacillus halodenitrificans]MYL58582.1 response regulator [Virgibacillus halodenitrificans]CDQ35295.1 Staphylococcal respiratory response protein A [Virgibacillus halodenitrificans]